MGRTGNAGTNDRAEQHLPARVQLINKFTAAYCEGVIFKWGLISATLRGKCSEGSTYDRDGGKSIQKTYNEVQVP